MRVVHPGPLRSRSTHQILRRRSHEQLHLAALWQRRRKLQHVHSQAWQQRYRAKLGHVAAQGQRPRQHQRLDPAGTRNRHGRPLLLALDLPLQRRETPPPMQVITQTRKRDERCNHQEGKRARSAHPARKQLVPAVRKPAFHQIPIHHADPLFFQRHSLKTPSSLIGEVRPYFSQTAKIV